MPAKIHLIERHQRSSGNRHAESIYENEQHAACITEVYQKMFITHQVTA